MKRLAITAITITLATGMATGTASAATVTLKPAFTAGSSRTIDSDARGATTLMGLRFVGGQPWRGRRRLGFVDVLSLPQFGQVACWGVPETTVCQAFADQRRGGGLWVRNNSSYRLRVSYR